MNYVPRFYQWKDLIKIHICRESFISIAYVVVKQHLEVAPFEGGRVSNIEYQISKVPGPRKKIEFL